MIYIVRTLLYDNYDIYERTGFPKTISIPKRDALTQILNDIIENNRYLEFISSLIDLQENGHKGRKIKVINLRNVVQGIIERGYLYDTELRQFVENSSLRTTRNWGFLQNGNEYTLTFLSIDLVQNSKAVKDNPKEIVQKAYSDIRSMVNEAVLSRNGRLWAWEGDGGIAAYALADRHQAASLSAMEILHNLLIYNGVSNKLSNPPEIRMAVHNGPIEYSGNNEDLTKSETIQQVQKIEHEYTPPNSVTISIVVRNMIDDIIARQFQLIENHGHYQYFNYSVKLEK